MRFLFKQAISHGNRWWFNDCLGCCFCVVGWKSISKDYEGLFPHSFHTMIDFYTVMIFVNVVDIPKALRSCEHARFNRKKSLEFNVEMLW